MANKREKIGKFEEQILYSEVDGNCPLCLEPLHHEKNGKLCANYDKAHIYPLNPTVIEIELLKNEPKLTEDINDINNLILLCKKCHFKFDNPRTSEEYKLLYNAKLVLIHKNNMRDIYSMFGLEKEVRDVLNKLNIQEAEEPPELVFNAKRIDEKANATLPNLLRRQIKNDVIDYFDFIKTTFIEIDKDKPHKFDTIATQIKAFYLKCLQNTENQELIFYSIVDWINNKTDKLSRKACEIIVSYFIQDCEVF